jgi:hypothetical protein
MADWRNSLERMRNSRPLEALPPLIDDPGVEEVSSSCAPGSRRVASWEMSLEAPDAIELTPFDAWLLTKVA